MSHETYSCVDLSQVTDDELAEARKQLIASAKKFASRKVWQTITTKEKRTTENQEFTLCQRCVVECPDNEILPLE
jgi:Pyruvate/2-oxoacid:ferredoxin oxidoreductase delta subunit